MNCGCNKPKKYCGDIPVRTCCSNPSVITRSEFYDYKNDMKQNLDDINRDLVKNDLKVSQLETETVRLDAGKQNKLIAGHNITLTDNPDKTTTITATGSAGAYYAGDGINVINNEISVNDTIQRKLTAGSNVTIDTNNVISATDTNTEYTAGDNIEIGPTNEISAIIPNVYGFDTVADMKASTELKDGDYAVTTGYYNKDDGGESKYQIRTKGGSDTPDDMMLIAVGTALVAELVVDTEINSKQCGLLGDGTTDETDKLNTFFSLSTDYDKVLNKGIYLISDTVTIRGRWADRYPSPYRIKFEQASIRYKGAANGCSILVCEHKHSVIDGLNVATDSDINYVEVVGCWYNDFSNWFVVNNLRIADTTSKQITLATTAVMYAIFDHLRIQKGKIILHQQDEWVNSVAFNDSIIGGQTVDCCIDASSTNIYAFNNILFQNTDLSYATDSVLKINNDLSDSATFTFYNCYFDSSIPLLYNNDNRKALINTFACIVPNKFNFYPTNFGKRITEVNLGNKTSSGNSIGTENVNYVMNGDISSSNEVASAWSHLFGPTSATLQKEYVSSPLNVNNRARKITLLQAPASGTQYINIHTLTNPPRDGLYTAYIRMKIISGTFDDLDLHFQTSDSKISRADITDGEEFLLVNQTNRYLSASDTFSLYLVFNGVVNPDIVFEVYEVGLILGTTMVPYPKLHKLAEI